MPNQTSDWLPDLQSQYLSRADKKLAELSHALESFIAKPKDVACERRLRNLLHNIIGSGGSFGFARITEAARGLASVVKESRKQRWPIGDQTAKALRAGLEKVREAFGKAMAEREPKAEG